MLFNNKSAKPTDIHQVIGCSAYCRVCNASSKFSRCWFRVEMVSQCCCCGLKFEHPEEYYRQILPACPTCGEYLEQPSFQYGLCDTCGSKYELIKGTRPSLLPNHKQRVEMDKYGKVRFQK